MLTLYQRRSVIAGVFNDSWIFKRIPGTSFLPDGNRVELLDYWGVEYAFLWIRKDPGGRVVHAGLYAMGLGKVIALFLSHRKIWVNVLQQQGGTRVVLGATANRNRGAFEKKLDRIISTLRRSVD